MNTGTSDAPALESLWDFADPSGTEARFRELLVRVQRDGDAAREAEVLTQIARAQGLQQRFEDAHATLDAADALIAPEMHVARVRSLLERGRALNSARRPAESIAPFTEALRVAEAAGLESLAIDAAHMLAIASRGEEAIAWNRRGLEMAQRARDPAARRWRGTLANNLGWALFDLGRHEEALQAFRVSLEAEEERGIPFRIGIAQWSIGKTLRALGRVEEALELQMRVLERPERANNPAEGFSREEIGECLLLLGRADEARPHFARAWELLHDDPWLARDEPERLARLAQLGGKVEIGSG